MIINNNQPISFQAKFINSTQILKHAGQNVYKPLKTSFIEIDASNKNDIAALDEIVKYWDNSFACNIFATADAMRRGIFDIGDYKIYALTKQTDTFDNLNVNGILGLVEVTPRAEKHIFIDYIQVNPENIYTTEPQYHKIGSRILDSLKILADRITLKPNSRGSSIFYKKNDFKPLPERSDVLEWVRD